MSLLSSKHNLCTIPAALLIGITFFFLVDNLTSEATPLGQTDNSILTKKKEEERILQLLRSRHFQQLDEYYLQLQRLYEEGNGLDDWQLLGKYQPFYNTSPANEPLLTEWITEFPKSYPARLARGIYYRKVGEEKRGGEWVRKTPRENLNQLSKYLDLATDDLLLSRSLALKPIVSLVHLLNITKHRDGDLGNRYRLEEANRIDPANFGARRRYMLTLTPRWGGSYEEMHDFLRECRSQQIPAEHIRMFEAIIHSDMANMLRHDRRPAEAFQHFRHALVLLNGIDNPDTIDTIEALQGLIYAAQETNTLERVTDDLDRYLSIMPHDVKILSYRGIVRERQGRFEEASADFTSAAMQGHAWSQFRIGQRLLFNSPSVTEKNQQEGLTWVKKSAQQGYEPALKLLQQLGLGLDTSPQK